MTRFRIQKRSGVSPVPELIWTRQAVEDVQDIKSYIQRGSARYAQVVAERIVEAAERLREFPHSGRAVPEFGRQDVREVLWGNYRIIHRVVGDSVFILTVHHGARLLRIPGE